MAAETTGERPASLAHGKIIDEAKRLEEATLYSMKGHHNAAAGWRSWNFILGFPSVVISGLVGATAFTKAAEQEPVVGLIAGGFAIAVAILTGITTFLNPNEKENAHLAAAHGYDKINNDARFFHSITCWQGESDEVLSNKLRALIDEKDKLNAKSPQIPKRAYEKGKRGIAAGEADFKVDKQPTPAQVEAPNVRTDAGPTPAGQ